MRKFDSETKTNELIEPQKSCPMSNFSVGLILCGACVCADCRHDLPLVVREDLEVLDTYWLLSSFRGGSSFLHAKF
jgi:hypothetical protein